MKADVKKFHNLLDAGKIPVDWRDKYENKFFIERLIESIKSGIPPFMVATRFAYKTWNSIIENWDIDISIANDSQTVGQLFRLYCFEKIDRNQNIGIVFDKFIKMNLIRGHIISHVDDMVTKYQNTWYTEVIFELLSGLVSDFDKKKLGGVHTPLILVRKMYDNIPDVWSGGKILDPACGNGSFLWEAKQRCFANGYDEKEIIENMILGVDIDRKKVYITSALLDPEGKYESRVVLADSLTFLDREVWKMKFDIVVGNPPYTKGAKLLYTYFFKNALELSKGKVAFIMPVDLNSRHDKLKFHNIRIKTHMDMISDNVSHHFDVNLDNIYYIIADTKTKNTVKPLSDECEYEILHPNRKRLTFITGDTKCGETKYFKNGTDVVYSVSRGDQLNIKRINPEYAKNSNRWTSANYSVFVNYTPSMGFFNCSILKKCKMTWTRKVFMLNCETMNEATKIKEWLQSQEMQDYILFMLKSKGDNFYTMSLKMMNDLPYYE